ncbi:MAG: energy-coupling factor transporter ATPase, partial [Clostridiales bacterium]|nr:energy-coupling factor transporter ATPase [Clostridiales bacterium]
NKEMGMTVLFITHYMDEAAQANRVVVMDNGKLILDGTPKEVFSQVEKIKSVGLDVPQSAELAYRLRKEGFDLPDDILSVDECVQAIAKELVE